MLLSLNPPLVHWSPLLIIYSRTGLLSLSCIVRFPYRIAHQYTDIVYLFHKKFSLNLTFHSRNPFHYSTFPFSKAPIKCTYSHNLHCIPSHFFLSTVILISFSLPDLLLSRSAGCQQIINSQSSLYT